MDTFKILVGVCTSLTILLCIIFIIAENERIDAHSKGLCYGIGECECNKKCEKLGMNFFEYKDGSSASFFASTVHSECWCEEDNKTIQIC